MADEKILQALGMRRRSRDKGLPLSSARAIRRAINVGVMRREWGDGAQKAVGRRRRTGCGLELLNKT